MGSIIEAIKGLDQASPALKEQTEIINLLDKMATTKKDLFQSQIETRLRLAKDLRGIETTRILGSSGETHAISSKIPLQTITDTVKKSTASFIKGGAQNIVDGICDLLSSAVATILGAGAGEQGSIDKTLAWTDGLKLVRFDVLGWSYRVQGVGINTVVQSASAFYYTNSSVKVDALDFQDYVNLYEDGLAAKTPPLTPAEKIQEIKQLRAVYDALTKKNINELPKEDRVLFRAA